MTKITTNATGPDHTSYMLLAGALKYVAHEVPLVRITISELGEGRKADLAIWAEDAVEFAAAIRAAADNAIAGLGGLGYKT